MSLRTIDPILSMADNRAWLCKITLFLVNTFSLLFDLNNMLHVRLGSVLLTVLVIQWFANLTHAGRTDWSVEKNASFWREEARLSIDEILKKRDNTRVAKNVIMFLGDGMGVSTVTAGRIRKGQANGQLGEDLVTEMEQFSHLGLAKT